MPVPANIAVAPTDRSEETAPTVDSKKALGDLCYLAAAPSTSHCGNWALFMKIYEALKPGASTPWTELPLETDRLPDCQG